MFVCRFTIFFKLGRDYLIKVCVPPDIKSRLNQSLIVRPYDSIYIDIYKLNLDASEYYTQGDIKKVIQHIYIINSKVLHYGLLDPGAN